MISRWSSPIPAMIVCPVSSSVLTLKVGSSSASFWRPVPSLSMSAFVLGSIAMRITGSGKSIFSSTIGWSGSVSVSPVLVSFSPTIAQMSPARTMSTSSRELACMKRRRPARSLFSFVALKSASPLLSVPE